MDNYIVEEGIVSRSNQDGTVIIMKMDDGNTFFKINGVAAYFWKELALKKEINSIVKDILNNYDVEESKLRSDLENLINTLSNKALIKKV